MHVSSVLEQSLLGLKGTKTNKNAAHHKEECKAQMKRDSIDRDKFRKSLVMYIAPSSADGHLQEIVHIHSEKLSTKEINVDSCKTVGEKQLQQFINNLLDSFYKPLTAAVHCTKMKFSIKDFFSKCDQIRSYLWIWAHLLKKSLMKNFIFCVVSVDDEET